MLFCISRTWFIVLFHLICMCCFVYPEHDSLYCSIWFVCVVLYIQNMIHCTVPSDLYVLICISRTWFIVLFPLICMCCFVYLEHDSLYCSIWFDVLFCISRTWFTVLFHLICMCCFVYPEHDSLYCSIWFVCVVLYIQNMIHCTVPSNLYVLFCISRTWRHCSVPSNLYLLFVNLEHDCIVQFHLICMCCFVYPEHDSLYCSIWFVCVVLYIQNMNNCTVQSDLYVLLCISKTWFIVLFPLICKCWFVYLEHDSLYCSLWFVSVVLYI